MIDGRRYRTDAWGACGEHVYPGGDIDPRQFFRIRNLTRRVRRLQPTLTFQLRSEFCVLALPTPPDIPSLRVLRPLNPPRPNDRVGFLPRIHASAVAELEDIGIQLIRDIPGDLILTEY